MGQEAGEEVYGLGQGGEAGQLGGDVGDMEIEGDERRDFVYAAAPDGDLRGDEE